MAKKKIEEVSVEVKQEQDMLDLTGVIKAEMDDEARRNMFRHLAS